MSGENAEQPGAGGDVNDSDDDSTKGEFANHTKPELQELAKEEIAKIEKSRFCCCFGCSWHGGLKWAYATLLFYGLFVSYTFGLRVEEKRWSNSVSRLLYTIELINGIAFLCISMLGFFGLSTNDLRSLSQTTS